MATRMASGRRRFLKAAGYLSGGALAPLGGLTLDGLPRVAAAEAQLDPKLVKLDGAIAPLVRLIEETPRERLVEEMGTRVRAGVAYRDVVAALLLAGIRNVEPRPVGFKFHAVLVVNSAHQASLASADEHRWLPIFWALDHFKGSQAEQAAKNGWRMGPLAEAKIPPAHKARQSFIDAMEKWDLEAAEPAAAALARTAGSHEAFELFCRYGMRDFRDIGHKAIFVAGAWRVLDMIGWQHAEPVLRSLARALLYYTGPSPAGADLEPDRPWRKSRAVVTQIRPAWREGRVDDGATSALLSGFRTAGAEEMPKRIVELLNAGVAARSIWDGCFLAGGEINLGRSDILSLHALTTMNALRYCFDATADDENRRLLLLQAAAFVPLFRDRIEKPIALDRLEPAAPEKDGGDAVEEILAAISGDMRVAARKVLGYLRAGRDPAPVIEGARRLVFWKGKDSHDYKWSAAVLEDFAHVSPRWRPPFLAASVAHLRGSQAPTSPLPDRVRSALATRRTN